jgi:hypothetical protein
VHDPEVCSLDRVVGVEGVRYSMLAVVVCTELFQLHLLCGDADFPLHDRPGPEEAELLHYVLDCWSISRWVG